MLEHLHICNFCSNFAVEFPKERKDIAIVMKKQQVHSIYSTTSLTKESLTTPLYTCALSI